MRIHYENFDEEHAIWNLCAMAVFQSQRFFIACAVYRATTVGTIVPDNASARRKKSTSDHHCLRYAEKVPQLANMMEEIPWFQAVAETFPFFPGNTTRRGKISTDLLVR